MPLLTDIWRSGIIHAPMADVVANGLVGLNIEWLPSGPSFTFLADPFGVWRGGELFMFVETFDYRTRIGGVDVLRFNSSFRFIERRSALREPWHLSYPVVLESDGETWMLPEAHRSGKLTLYRAVEFPTRWEAAATIELDGAAIDASPVFHNGLWWLLYTPNGDKRAKISTLHVAFAERLTGPWRLHPRNPVRVDVSSARPGGTPIVLGEQIFAPMQDCASTYGGAIRMLCIDELTTEAFSAEAGLPIAPPPEFAPFNDGLHTLSACGGVTLIDAKRIDRSLNGLGIDLARLARKKLNLR